MKHLLIIGFFVSFHGFINSCSEKDGNANNPTNAFAAAKSPYDDGNHELALQKLGEFKSRFPYSKLTALAHLYIANSQFELGRYEAASSSYNQFIQLYPKHAKVDFALFRIGESFWVDAPEEVDREQEYTLRAISEWQGLISRFPKSPFTQKAKKFINVGRLRIAKSIEFIASFYCKQELYHACAYRYVRLADQYPQYKDLRKKALAQASEAFLKLAEEKTVHAKRESNLYFKTMSAKELREYSRKLKKESDSIKL